MKTIISIINKLEMLPQNIPLNINNISCTDNYNYIINYNISIIFMKNSLIIFWICLWVYFEFDYGFNIIYPI